MYNFLFLEERGRRQ